VIAVVLPVALATAEDAALAAEDAAPDVAELAEGALDPHAARAPAARPAAVTLEMTVNRRKVTSLSLLVTELLPTVTNHTRPVT
jgi:hypothetical protein